MLVPPERLSAVLLMISNKSVSICNHSHARLVDSGRNRAFWSGCPNLMPSYGGFVEPKGSNLTPLISTFNVENYVCRLSWSISSDFDAVHCWNVSQPKIAKYLPKTILGVQGRSRSSMLVPPESLSAVLVMISINSVSIWNRSHAGQANSGKRTICYGGYPSVMPSFEGNLTHQHKIWS